MHDVGGGQARAGWFDFLRPRTAYAQTPPATFYGKGLRPGDLLEARIGERPCVPPTRVNAQGKWVIAIASDAVCGPAAGARVEFFLNGALCEETDAWQPGGIPRNVADGIILHPKSAQP